MMWSKIVPVCLCLMLLHNDFGIHGQEPLCNRFSFEEQLLDKMVRMEVKVQTMFESIVKTQSEIKDLSLKVGRELHSVSKERQRIKNDIAVYKADTSKKLSEESEQIKNDIAVHKADTSKKLSEESKQIKNDIAVHKADTSKKLSEESEQIKNDIAVHKADTSKKLSVAAYRVQSSVADFENKIMRFSSDIHDLKNVSRGLSSVTYIRWGRASCPNATHPIYEGFASGSGFSHTGGPAHTICLPRDPQFGKTYSGRKGNYIYNAEYNAGRSSTQAIFGESMKDEDVPCVVCEATRKSSVLMIPARQECYEGWDVEYTGYLMTSHQTHQRSDLKCVDVHPERVPGQSGNNDGDLFYFVTVSGTIPDPPYTRGSELTCVVCTK